MAPQNDLSTGRVQQFQVVSELRSPDAVHFLRHALHRPEPEIWKQALDGLVTIRGIEDLEHVLSSTLDEQKRSWIIEAITQARADSLDQPLS